MNDNREDKEGFCDNQPVIQGALIQDFGVLFVLDLSCKILQVSMNAHASLGFSCAQLLGNKITEFIDSETLRAVQEGLKSRDMKPLNGMGFNFKTSAGFKTFSASFSLFENYWILELEFLPEKIDSNREWTTQNKILKLALDLKKCLTAQEMYDRTTRGLKAILSMDKVMIYGFDQSWHGTVLSEAKEPGMEAYLGLKFPATDVPEPVRRLYLLKRIRMIPGIDTASVRLEPIQNPLTGELSDLRMGILRGVAPVHLEYLKNMEVTASISVAILHKEILWGLIAFHQRAYKTFSAIIRNALEILSECFSWQLSHLEEIESHHEVLEIDRFRKIASEMAITGELPEQAFSEEMKTLLGVMKAQGSVLFMDGHWFTWGKVPARADLELLAKWLQNENSDSVYSTHSLAKNYAGGEKIKNIASGLLAVSITGAYEEFVLWVRPEEAQIVNWGGDPGQTLHFEPDQKTYHPRQSFKIWKETVQGQSLFWESTDKNAANQIRLILSESLLRGRSARLKTLSGLLPICAYCKKIRDEKDSWQKVEAYVQNHSNAKFSHGICPDCYKATLEKEGLQR